MFSFLTKAQKALHEADVLMKLAQLVVLALEQTAGDSQSLRDSSSLHATGPEKKRMALQMLLDLAHSYGLDPPVLLLDTAIEAAVRSTKKP